MTRANQILQALLWTLAFLSVALGSLIVGPLYWLSGFLLWAAGFCTLVAQAPRLHWSRAAVPAWGRYALGAGAAGTALCYFAASPTLFAGWFVGLTSVLMLFAAPGPPTGRWALLATTVGFLALPWAVLRHTSVLPSIATGNAAHLDLLLRCGADPNERLQHETPLIAAVQLGRDDLVEALLRHGADPNGRSSAFMNSTAALFYAAQLPAAQQRVVGLLLQFGADSTRPNGSGQRVWLPAQWRPPTRPITP